MEQFYTYIYFNKEVPIYVGKGSGPRAYKHLKGCYHNKYFDRKIKKMLREGIQPTVKIIYVNNEKEAHELEKFLISEIGRKDKKLGPLLNNTDGGEGTTGMKHSEKTKKLFSESRKGLLAGDKNPAKRPEVAAKISASCMGRNLGVKKPEQSKRITGEGNPRWGVSLDEETKKKIGKANKGKTLGVPRPYITKRLTNTKWVHNNVICKQVPKDFNEEGWVNGRLPFKKKKW